MHSDSSAGSSKGSITNSSLDLLNVPSDPVSHTLTPTEEYVKDLSVALFEETLNKKNYNTPLLKHWDPKLLQQHEILEPVVGTQDVLENIKLLHDANPDYHMQVLNATAKVTERTGRATVWILQLVHESPGSAPIESVNVLSWVRRDGEWYCTKHKGMRGMCAGLPSLFDMHDLEE